MKNFLNKYLSLSISGLGVILCAAIGKLSFVIQLIILLIYFIIYVWVFSKNHNKNIKIEKENEDLKDENKILKNENEDLRSSLRANLQGIYNSILLDCLKNKISQHAFKNSIDRLVLYKYDAKLKSFIQIGRASSNSQYNGINSQTIHREDFGYLGEAWKFNVCFYKKLKNIKTDDDWLNFMINDTNITEKELKSMSMRSKLFVICPICHSTPYGLVIFESTKGSKLKKANFENILQDISNLVVETVYNLEYEKKDLNIMVNSNLDNFQKPKIKGV